eukprot:1175341-Amphidinium_carterae.1
MHFLKQNSSRPVPARERDACAKYIPVLRAESQAPLAQHAASSLRHGTEQSIIDGTVHVADASWKEGVDMTVSRAIIPKSGPKLPGLGDRPPCNAVAPTFVGEVGRQVAIPNLD